MTGNVLTGYVLTRVCFDQGKFGVHMLQGYVIVFVTGYVLSWSMFLTRVCFDQGYVIVFCYRVCFVMGYVFDQGMFLNRVCF